MEEEDDELVGIFNRFFEAWFPLFKDRIEHIRQSNMNILRKKKTVLMLFYNECNDFPLFHIRSQLERNVLLVNKIAKDKKYVDTSSRTEMHSLHLMIWIGNMTCHTKTTLPEIQLKVYGTSRYIKLFVPL